MPTIFLLQLQNKLFSLIKLSVLLHNYFFFMRKRLRAVNGCCGNGAHVHGAPEWPSLTQTTERRVMVESLGTAST